MALAKVEEYFGYPDYSGRGQPTTVGSTTPETWTMPVDRPPFVAPIDNVTANIGEDVTLTCRVKNLKSHMVTK